MRYVRDMRGYGVNPVNPSWPGNANVAVQFVVNYEEGGENCILHGDAASEAFLSEIVGAAPWPGLRHWNMESIYEYGARAGFWRLYRMFDAAGIPVTVYGVASALARSPDQVAAMQAAGWEIASHGLKWIDYREYEQVDEERDMKEAIRVHTEVTGARPTGWYTGRTSANTVRIVAQEGGFAYISDVYDDDLPYWLDHDGHGNAIKPQLMIPYTLDANDMRFATAQGFNTGDHFYSYLKDTFDTLYAEGEKGRPSMMSIGLHCRLTGRPGRAAGLQRFIDYVKGRDKVWFPRRIDIADHWREAHPYKAPTLRPSRMNRREFVDKFGDIFEHSAWIAEGAFDLELGLAHDSAGGLHNALCRAFRSASKQNRLDALIAQTDFVSMLAQAKSLMTEPAFELTGTGLDTLDDAEWEKIVALNDTYVRKFGHPFIVAAQDNDKASILKALETRIANSDDKEFDISCKQLERIAWYRLHKLLPS